MTPTHNENEDRQLDANLRRLGEALKLPAVPEKFTTAPAETPSRLTKGVRYMKNHRLMTVFGAGSALAAAIAIAVSLIGFGSPAKVEAAAIFQSWREAVSRAFSLELTNIRHEGFTIQGRVLMSLPREAPGVPEDPAGMKAFIDLHVEADENAEELAGLNADIAVGAETGNEWVYLKMAGMPAEFHDEPMAVYFAQMARNGIILDLNGLLLDGGLIPTAFIDHGTGEEDDAANRKLKFGIQLGHSNPSSAPASSPQQTHHFQVLNMGGHVQIETDESDDSADDDSGDGQAGTEGTGADEAASHEFRVVTEWFEGLFNGTLTSEQMAAMVSHIEAAAREVNVVSLPDGGFSLIARDFNHDGNGLDSDDQDILEQLEVEIRYAQTTGVQWVELRNLGDGPGTIRFEQLADGIDPALLDRSRYTSGGMVPVFPLSGLMNLVHGSHGPNGTDANGGSSNSADNTQP